MITGILLGIVAGLLANELCEFSPWCARKLVRWSAVRRYTEPSRAEMRAEELIGLINDRPGNLFKLTTAVGFAAAAVIIAGRRVFAREPDAGTDLKSLPASPGLLTSVLTIARERLEEMRDDLDRSISILQGERPGPQAGAGYPQDSADAGSVLSEADRTEAILHSARRQRDEVLAALARIDENIYGRCVDCGGNIPEGRLEARPDAARCVDCQARHARRSRLANPLPGYT